MVHPVCLPCVYAKEEIGFQFGFHISIALVTNNGKFNVEPIAVLSHRIVKRQNVAVTQMVNSLE